MDPFTIGSLALGGANLGAGIWSTMMGQSNYESQAQFQRDLATKGIRWRVRDAERAGIHPLYAIGAPAFGGSPVSMPGDSIGPALADAGQNIGAALSRTQSAEQRQKNQLELALLASQIGESDARRQMYLSEARRQAPSPGAGFGAGLQMEGTELSANLPGQGVVEITPTKQLTTKTGRPDIVAGLHPAYAETSVDKGLTATLPLSQGESLEETISEMSPGAWIGLLGRNARDKGPAWLWKFLGSRYLGVDPRLMDKMIGVVAPQPRGREVIGRESRRNRYMYRNDNPKYDWRVRGYR